MSMGSHNMMSTATPWGQGPLEDGQMAGVPNILSLVVFDEEIDAWLRRAVMRPYMPFFHCTITFLAISLPPHGNSTCSIMSWSLHCQ